MIKVRKNEELSGIEVVFGEKPDMVFPLNIPEVEVRAALKESGFRWDRINQFWYAKETPERLEVAENIVSIFST